MTIFHTPTAVFDRLRRDDMPRGAHDLWTEIVLRSQKFGWCWARQADLARRLDVCVRTVRAIERALERAGLVQTHRVALWGGPLRGGTLRVLVPLELAKGVLQVAPGLLERLKEWMSARIGRLWRTATELMCARRSSERQMAAGLFSEKKKSEPEGGSAPESLFEWRKERPRRGDFEAQAPPSGRANPAPWTDHDTRTDAEADADMQRTKAWAQQMLAKFRAPAQG